MQFGIAGLGMGAPLIEISEEEFLRVKVAKQKIVRSLAVEDKFDLVLANYAEFEREILGLAVHQMVYFDLSWSSMRFDTQTLNRRVANLLSAGRLYIDQIMHDAGVLVGEDELLVELIRKKSSEQYDARLGYRVMETLRNYTQHRALPVHQLSYPCAWVPPGEWKNLMYRTVPSIVLQDLREDTRVKRSVIADLEEIGPDVPLTPLIREYVEGLSIVHEEFRKHTQPDISSWVSSFAWVWEQFNNRFGTIEKAVQVVAVNDKGEHVETEQIFEDIVTHLKDLAKKNGLLTNLARRFVSGACELREE